MNLSIRQARLEDLEVIVDFNARLAEETEHKTLDRSVLRKGVTAVLKQTDRGIYLVAESGKDVVGQLLLTYEWSDWRNGVFWWIQSVYVRSEWRGKHVFTSLYEHVLQRAKTEGNVCGLRLYVEHDNTRAQNTYRTLGMEQTGYQLFEVDFTAGKTP